MYFLPHHPADLIALAQILLAFLALGLVGRFAGGPRAEFETDAMAGWGLLSILLTLWGVATSLSLRLPAIGFLVAAALVLAVPILVIMATAQPSQSDIFMNLLPNAAYLADHGFLPTADGPDA